MATMLRKPGRILRPTVGIRDVRGCQVVGVGQGLVAGPGGRELLAVTVQYGGQYAQRPARRGGRGERGDMRRRTRRGRPAAPPSPTADLAR